MTIKYPKGSEWRRWDLHIHTPSSALNNNFSGWDSYLAALEDQSEVSIIGATDYASIEGYKRLIKEKTENGRLKNIDKIFPNIEFRITPFTKKSKGINLHLIFNPDLPDHIERIEDSLGRLVFDYDDENFPCTQSGLTRLGRSFNPDLTGNSEAFVEGANQFKISIDKLKEWHRNESWVFKNSIVIVANGSTDGASGIQHDDGLAAVRREIYRFSDAIFSSRQGDRTYFLGKGTDDKATIVKLYNSLKPCLHGSDAHEETKLFKPDQNRYCWIKADPTFEGLKQVVFEPESRIAIQETHPEQKVNYEVIDFVKFIDKSENKIFQSEPIQLNSGLNSIIGGKSSGKSLALYHIAHTVNREETEKKRSLAGSSNYSEFETTSNFDFEVHWRDGSHQALSSASEQRPITYIPQLYINKLAEENGRRQLNEIVRETIYQDNAIKEQAELLYLSRDQINEKISSHITKLVSLRNHLYSAKKDFEKAGNIESVTQEILRIKKEIERIQKSSGFTDEENYRYKKLSLRLSIVEQRKLNLLKFKEELEELQKALLEQLASASSSSRLLNEPQPRHVQGIRNRIVEQFRSELNKVRLGIESSISIEQKRVDQVITAVAQREQQTKEALQKFSIKVKSQNELKELQQKLKREQDKLKTIQNAKKNLDLISEQGKLVSKQLRDYYEELFSKYEDLENLFNRAADIDSKSIRLTASVSFDHTKFDSFISCFDGRGSLRALLGHAIDDNNRYSFQKDTHLESIFDIESNIRDYHKIEWKVRKSADEESLLRNLLQDCFYISFNMLYKGDDIISMSPGKRGLVLLHLLLHLSNSSHPILIDQPEDNLDNRTVYNELRDFIRERKEKRQIIMVTHNANMVVATDSECVIIANQAGQQHDMENEEFRFEYISGAIECTFNDPCAPSLLKKFGIREHICEVLEGGQLAFEERERKYSFKN